jgi:hypothetical protein
MCASPGFEIINMFLVVLNRTQAAIGNGIRTHPGITARSQQIVFGK